MPRKPRVFSSTGIYHIILRSVNQHIIFEDDTDYLKFLYILSDCREKYSIDVYAYCLMDNHIHLIVNTPPDKLASFFQSVGTRFVRWYNTKYRRTGHLFQDRFHSTVIETERTFLSTLIYIHNNPVKANVCRYPSEYRWSSFNAYYGEKNTLLNVRYAYDIAGSKEMLLKYFAKNFDSTECNYLLEIEKMANRFFTDEKALEIFKNVTKLDSTSEVEKLGKKLRNNYVRKLKKEGLTLKQLSRLMNISLSTVIRICKNDT
ncbi:MAG: transposase [Lachnospiraceae bacterium]|nr:transposase [Lachnospiraceae bacterium]